MNLFNRTIESSFSASLFEPIKIHHDEPNAISSLKKSFLSIPTFRDSVIVCIGTDRSTGDSLGPMIGTFLTDYHFALPVYGTLDEPVHATNLEENLKKIKEEHPYSTIIAVDACLGRVKNVGFLSVLNEPIKPGAGVNKELPFVGEYSVKGIVNVSGFMEFFVLQNTRLSLVMKMAKAVSNAMFLAYHASSNLDKEKQEVHF